jgi:probable HAF family extracellular repeat protein
LSSRAIVVALAVLTLAVAGAVAAFLAHGQADAALSGWTIHDLGALGEEQSDAVAVNDGGEVVGWASTGSDGAPGYVYRTFVWRDGVMTDLGTMRTSSAVGVINDNGQVVGWVPGTRGADGRESRARAVLWEDGTTTVLGTPGRANFAFAINDRGRVVGESNEIDPTPNDVGGHPRAVVLQPGRSRSLGALPERDSSEAVAVNERGTVIGFGYDNDSMPGIALMTRGFVWRDGVLVDLGALPGRTSSEPRAINDGGAVVGSSWYEEVSYVPKDVPEQRRAFVWTTGKMREIGPADAASSEAVGINDRGQVVGTWSTTPEGGRSQARGFVWDAGRTTTLGVLPGGTRSEAVAINDSGLVIGNSRGALDPQSGGEHERAFVWQNGRIGTLETLPSGTTTHASAVNDAGVVVGRASTREGRQHAVVWTPPRASGSR